MFTNCEVDEILKIIEQNWNKIEHEYLNINKHLVFIKIVKNCISNGYLKYNNKYYKIKGLTMGGNLSVIAANILTQSGIRRNKQHTQITSYVNDIFVVVKITEIENIKNKLNQCYKQMKFTTEKEEDEAIPFLDVYIKKEDGGKISTN